MAASPARFTFDLDLGRKREKSRVLSEAAIEELVQQARMDGFAEGFKEGEKSVAAVVAQELAAAAAALADRSAAMNLALDEAKHQAVTDAVELAAGIARKLASQLIAREPVAELEALIAECLSSLEGVPHLVIRCAPDLADAIRAAAEAQMATSGFGGRLVVLGDPEIENGDGRIEWADGGLVRDSAALSAEIDEHIRAYLAARHKSPMEGTP
jgi:flagellar assembly protein FliH